MVAWPKPLADSTEDDLLSSALKPLTDSLTTSFGQLQQTVASVAAPMLPSGFKLPDPVSIFGAPEPSPVQASQPPTVDAGLPSPATAVPMPRPTASTGQPVAMPTGQGPSDVSDEQWARQEAQRLGIDPEIAVRVGNSEGGFTQPGRQSDIIAPDGQREQSFSAYQLNVNGGLGNAALAAGIDPRDPAQSKRAITFALEHAARNGWGAFHGAARVGIGEREGIGQAPLANVPNVPNVTLRPGQTTPMPAEETPAAQRQAFQAGSYTPNQIAAATAEGLDYETALAVCGPAAAIAFARKNGRNPSMQEALGLARQAGWTVGAGMAGPASQQRLLESMGVAARLQDGDPDWRAVAADVQRGNPVIISTPGHYFVAERYDPESGTFDFGQSAAVLRKSGGKTWFKPEELPGLGMGAPRGSLFMDSPQSPTASVVAGPSPLNAAGAPSLAATPTSPASGSPPTGGGAPGDPPWMIPRTTTGAPAVTATTPPSTKTSTMPTPLDSNSDPGSLMLRQPLGQPTPGDAFDLPDPGSMFLPGDGGAPPTPLPAPYDPDTGPREGGRAGFTTALTTTPAPGSDPGGMGFAAQDAFSQPVDPNAGLTPPPSPYAPAQAASMEPAANRFDQGPTATSAAPGRIASGAWESVIKPAVAALDWANELVINNPITGSVSLPGYGRELQGWDQLSQELGEDTKRLEALIARHRAGDESVLPEIQALTTSLNQRAGAGRNMRETLLAAGERNPNKSGEVAGGIVQGALATAIAPGLGAGLVRNVAAAVIDPLGQAQGVGLEAAGRGIAAGVRALDALPGAVQEGAGALRRGWEEGRQSARDLNAAPTGGGTYGTLGMVPEGAPPRVSLVPARARALADEHIAAHTEYGGSTINPTRGNLAGQPLYSVSLYPEQGITVVGRAPTTADIATFISDPKRRAILESDPRISVGTWLDTSNGNTDIDLVATLTDRKLAENLGRAYNQKAIFDLGNLEEIRTGGTGRIPNRLLPPLDQRLPLVGQADQLARQGLAAQAEEVLAGSHPDWWQREFGADPKAMAQANRLEAGLERALQQATGPDGLSQLDSAGLKPFATPTTKFPTDVIPRPTPVAEIRDVVQAGLDHGYGDWYREFAEDIVKSVDPKRAWEGLSLFVSFSAVLEPETAKKFTLATMLAAGKHNGFSGMDTSQIAAIVINTYKRAAQTDKGLYYMPVHFSNVSSIYGAGERAIGTPKLSNFWGDFFNGRLPWQSDAHPTNDVHMQRLEGYQSWGDVSAKLANDENTYRYGSAISRRVASELGRPVEDIQSAGWVVQQLSSLPTNNNGFAKARRLNLADPATAPIWKAAEADWKVLGKRVRDGSISPGEALAELERLKVFDLHNVGEIGAINADPAIVKLQAAYDAGGLKDMPMPGTRPRGDLAPSPGLRGGMAYKPVGDRPWMSADIRTRTQNPLNQRMLEEAPSLSVESASPRTGPFERDLGVPNRTVETGRPGERGIVLPTMNAPRMASVAEGLAESMGRPVSVRRPPMRGETATHVQVTLDAANAPGLTRSIAEVRKVAEEAGAEVHWDGQQARIYLDGADPEAVQRSLDAIYDGVQYQGINADALRVGGSRVERFEPGGSGRAGAGGIPATTGGSPATGWRQGRDADLTRRLADVFGREQPAGSAGVRAGRPSTPARAVTPEVTDAAASATFGALPLERAGSAAGGSVPQRPRLAPEDRFTPPLDVSGALARTVNQEALNAAGGAVAGNVMGGTDPFSNPNASPEDIARNTAWGVGGALALRHGRGLARRGAASLPEDTRGALATLGASPGTGHVYSPEPPPGQRRMYHGTPFDFPAVDPDVLSDRSLHGRGYYLTDDPQVASGYAVDRTPGTSALKSRVQIYEEWLPQARAKGESPAILADVEEKLQQARAELERVTSAGPNVRAVDVPHDLNLLDLDQPLRPDLLDRVDATVAPIRSTQPEIARIIDDIVEETSRGMQNGAQPTNAAFFRRLQDASEEIDQIRGLKNGGGDFSTELLTQSGYDGLRHTGGQIRPLLDDAGKPIEHNVNVIFPESVGKVRNAFSGTKGGGYLPFDPASAAAGGAAGAATGEDGEQADPLRTGAGVLAAGILGKRFPGAQRALQSATRRQAAMAAKGLSKPSAWDWLKQAGYAGIYGPATFVNSAVGGAQELVLGQPKEFVRALVSGRPGSYRAQARAQMRAAPEGLVGLGRVLLGNDASATAAVSGGSQGTAGLSERVVNPIGHLAARALERPGEILTEAPDAVFRPMFRAQGETREAHAIAAEMGMRGPKAASYADTLMQSAAALRANPTMRSTSAEAQRVVKAGSDYADELGYKGTPGAFGQEIAKFAKRDDAIGVLASFLVPFPSMAARMTTAAARSTPGVGLLPSVRRGQKTAFDVAYDQSFGSLVAIGIAYWAFNGGITGSGPSDTEKRQQMVDLGWQQNSVLIAGHYIPNRMFQRFQPMLDTAGEIHDALAYGKKDRTAPDLAADLVKRASRIATDQTGLSGLADLHDMLEGSFASQFPGWAARSMMRYVPYGGILRATATATDTKQRKPDRWSDQTPLGEAVEQNLAMAVPGLRQNVPAAQRALGQDAPNPQQGLGALVPRVTTQRDDPLVRAFQSAGVDIGAPPTDISGVALTPMQQRRYRSAMGRELERISGPTVTGPAWQTMPPATRKMLLETFQETARTLAEAAIRADGGAGFARKQADAVLKKAQEGR